MQGKVAAVAGHTRASGEHFYQLAHYFQVWRVLIHGPMKGKKPLKASREEKRRGGRRVKISNEHTATTNTYLIVHFARRFWIVLEQNVD